jgi:hypothetical protein
MRCAIACAYGVTARVGGGVPVSAVQYQGLGTMVAKIKRTILWYARRTIDGTVGRSTWYGRKKGKPIVERAKSVVEVRVIAKFLIARF